MEMFGFVRDQLDIRDECAVPLLTKGKSNSGFRVSLSNFIASLIDIVEQKIADHN